MKIKFSEESEDNIIRDGERGIETGESIQTLQDCNAWAKLYLDNPEFLTNMAKVRGMYLKALRKSGFSRGMAEKITYEHFDGNFFDGNEIDTTGD